MSSPTRVAPLRRAVFLHTGWRSAGTSLWSQFRALPWVKAYHEPLHEVLDTLTPAVLPNLRANTWASGHPALAQPYYHEYAPLLRGSGGVEGFHTSFSTDDAFADAAGHLPALQGYLTMLLDHAAGHGKQAVLKFCRSIGRVGWMRRAFPDAAHVVVLRNPATQFNSARQQYLRYGNPYFLVMPLVILLRNNSNDRVADMLRFFGVRLPHVPADMALPYALEACNDQVRSTSPEHWYRGFLALWLLGVLSLPDGIDAFIDGDLLRLSPGYRAAIEQQLRTMTALPVTLWDEAPTISVTSGIGVPQATAWQFHQTAALLLAARHGAAWAETPIGAPVSAMLAHADLVAAEDQGGFPDRGLDRAAYLDHLSDRATTAAPLLSVVHSAHAWRTTGPSDWLEERRRDVFRPV